MRELILSYDGTEYRCRTSYDVLMHIEDKVTLTSLANRLASGAASGDVPMSHIVWVFHCLLVGGGARVSMQDVFEAVKADKVPQSTIEDVLGFIIAEVFGVGPKEAVTGAEMPDEDEVKKP